MPKYVLEVNYTLDGVRGLSARAVPLGWLLPPHSSKVSVERSSRSTSPSVIQMPMS